MLKYTYFCIMFFFISMVGCNLPPPQKDDNIKIGTAQVCQSLSQEKKEECHKAYSSNRRQIFAYFSCSFGDGLLLKDKHITPALDENGEQLYTNLNRKEQNHFCCNMVTAIFISSANGGRMSVPLKYHKNYPCFY
ncbi:hypothetical protein KKG22_01785 [Patescibacteria group bacterium]|nr:hypothetical protein [Patescibacteria group bacterium]MBU1721934.1 hypothetical protein [Patescibacteria group bacterium]MBU1901794.1 hypothetical protein [Patescibacteria group bacterium]